MGASRSKLPTEKLAPSDLLVKDSEPKLKSSKLSFIDEKNSLKSSTGPASTAIKSETSMKSGSAAVSTAVATKKFQNKKNKSGKKKLSEKEKQEQKILKEAKYELFFYQALKKNLAFFSDLDGTLQMDILLACVSKMSDPKVISNPFLESGWTGDDKNENNGKVQFKHLNRPGKSFIKERGLIFILSGEVVGTLVEVDTHLTFEIQRTYPALSIIGLETAFLDLPSLEYVVPNFKESDREVFHSIDDPTNQELLEEHGICRKVIYTSIDLHVIQEILGDHLRPHHRQNLLIQNCYLVGTILPQYRQQLVKLIFNFFEIPKLFLNTLVEYCKEDKEVIEVLEPGMILDDSAIVNSNLFYCILYCGTVQNMLNKRIYKINYPIVITPAFANLYRVVNDISPCYCIPKSMLEGLMKDDHKNDEEQFDEFDYQRLKANFETFDPLVTDSYGNFGVILDTLEKYFITSNLLIQGQFPDFEKEHLDNYNLKNLNFRTVFDLSKKLVFDCYEADTDLIDVFDQSDDQVLVLLKDQGVRFPKEGRARRFLTSVSRNEVFLTESRIAYPEKVKIVKPSTFCRL